jgi:hypothetical protein
VVSEAHTACACPTVFDHVAEGQNFTSTRSQVSAVSPDGSMLAYVANNQLQLRRLDQFATQTIQGPDDIGTPLFSPDGRWIGFFSFGDNAIKTDRGHWRRRTHAVRRLQMCAPQTTV